MSIQIKVRPDAEKYVRAVIQECPGEVGGWGYLHRTDNGDFEIYKFVVLPQEASSGGVDFDDEGQHAELARAMDAGEIDNCRVSWHSHGNMSTFYSGTDEEAILKYKATGVPYLVSLIYNRQGEVKPRLDIFDSSVVSHITFSGDGLEYTVMLDRKSKSPIEVKAEQDVKKNVRTSKVTSFYGYGDGYGGSRALTRSECDKQGLCFWCEGEGRRMQWIAEAKERQLRPCKDCGGTGLSFKEARKIKGDNQKIANARRKATSRYNKRIRDEEAEAEAIANSDPTASPRWDDPGVAIAELDQEEYLAMCAHYGIDRETAIAWYTDPETGYNLNSAADLDYEDVKRLESGPNGKER